MLVDTSVPIRTLQPHHPLYVVAGENGLGTIPPEAAAELARIKGMFLFLPGTPTVYPAWEALVVGHAVSGKPSHDARLVAAMQVHGLTDQSYRLSLTGRAMTCRDESRHGTHGCVRHKALL
jgi:hypothetical protein